MLESLHRHQDLLRHRRIGGVPTFRIDGAAALQRVPCPDCREPLPFDAYSRVVETVWLDRSFFTYGLKLLGGRPFGREHADDLAHDYYATGRFARLVAKYDPYPAEAVLWGTLLVSAKNLRARGITIAVSATADEAPGGAVGVQVTRTVAVDIGLPRSGDGVGCTVDDVQQLFRGSAVSELLEATVVGDGNGQPTAVETLVLDADGQEEAGLWGSLHVRIRSQHRTAVLLRAMITNEKTLALYVRNGSCHAEVQLPRRCCGARESTVADVFTALNASDFSDVAAVTAIGDTTAPATTLGRRTLAVRGPERPTGEEWQLFRGFLCTDFRFYARDWLRLAKNVRLRNKIEPQFADPDDAKSKRTGRPHWLGTEESIAGKPTDVMRRLEHADKRQVVAEAMTWLRPCHYTVLIEHHGRRMTLEQLVGLVMPKDTPRHEATQGADELAIAWESHRLDYGRPPAPPTLDDAEIRRRTRILAGYCQDARNQLRVHLEKLQLL